MNYRKSFYLLWVLFMVGVALMYAYVAMGALPLAYVGVLCMIAGFLQTVKFFRCPHCGALWRIRGGIPKVCPECGREIR